MIKHQINFFFFFINGTNIKQYSIIQNKSLDCHLQKEHYYQFGQAYDEI